jgi:branched-subunit amino acid permease
MIITNPSISSSVGAFLAPFIITAHLLLYISTMHGTLSSLSSIMGATAQYPFFCGLFEQLSIIAAKFGVCSMAPTHTSLQCIIETSWIDASFECHGTMEGTMKF